MKKYKSTGNRWYKFERLERRIQQEYGTTEAKKLGWTKNRLARVISNVYKNKNQKAQTRIDKLSEEMIGQREELFHIKHKSKYTKNVVNSRPISKNGPQPLGKYVISRGNLRERFMRILRSFLKRFFLDKSLSRRYNS